MPLAPLTVVCALWDGEPASRGTRYTARHVNALHRMVAGHLSQPHRFVCLTDRRDGPDRDFAKGIKVVQALDAFDWPKRYRKLAMFSPMARQMIGPRFLYLDLDCLVVDDLAPLVDRTEDFVVWRDPGRNGGYNTSMILMGAGARPDPWASFCPDTSPGVCRRYTGSDQAWVTYRLGSGEATWGPEDGVLSYKRDCTNGVLPEGARIVFFHGNPKADQVEGWPRDRWMAAAA